MSFTMPSAKQIGEILLGTASVALTAYGFAKSSAIAESVGVIGDAITFYLVFS